MGAGTSSASVPSCRRRSCPARSCPASKPSPSPATSSPPVRPGRAAGGRPPSSRTGSSHRRAPRRARSTCRRPRGSPTPASSRCASSRGSRPAPRRPRRRPSREHDVAGSPPYRSVSRRSAPPANSSNPVPPLAPPLRAVSHTEGVPAEARARRASTVGDATSTTALFGRGRRRPASPGMTSGRGVPLPSVSGPAPAALGTRGPGWPAGVGSESTLTGVTAPVGADVVLAVAGPGAGSTAARAGAGPGASDGLDVAAGLTRAGRVRGPARRPEPGAGLTRTPTRPPLRAVATEPDDDADDTSVIRPVRRSSPAGLGVPADGDAAATSDSAADGDPAVTRAMRRSRRAGGDGPGSNTASSDARTSPGRQRRRHGPGG